MKRALACGAYWRAIESSMALYHHFVCWNGGGPCVLPTIYSEGGGVGDRGGRAPWSTVLRDCVLAYWFSTGDRVVDRGATRTEDLQITSWSQKTAEGRGSEGKMERRDRRMRDGTPHPSLRSWQQTLAVRAPSSDVVRCRGCAARAPAKLVGWTRLS